MFKKKVERGIRHSFRKTTAAAVLLSGAFGSGQRISLAAVARPQAASPAIGTGHDAAGTASSRWAPALSLHRFLRSPNANGETYGSRIYEFFIWGCFFFAPL